MSFDVKKMIKEIFIAFFFLESIILFVILFMFGGIFSFPPIKIRVILGVICSGICCIFMMLHMARAYCMAVEIIDPLEARKIMARSTVVRYGGILLVAFGCYLTGWVDMIAFAFGLLVLKPALYLQVVVHRILCKEDVDDNTLPVLTDEEEERLPGESHHLGPQMIDTISKINKAAEVRSEKEVLDDEVSNSESGC